MNARPLLTATFAAVNRTASMGTSSARSAIRSITGSGWMTRDGTLGAPSVVIFSALTRASAGMDAGASTAARTAAGMSLGVASVTGVACNCGTGASILR